MTVYIAKAGTPLVDNPTPSKAGHMWYSLSSDGTTELSYGFAPVSPGTTSTPGQVFRNDVENYTQYAYRKSIFITQAQYDTLKNFGDNPISKNFILAYDSLQNSCVDFVYKALGLISDTLGGYEGRIIPTWNIQDQKLRAVIQDIEIRNAVDPVPGASQGDPAAVQAVTVSVDKNAAEIMLGHPFDPTDAADVEDVANGISAGTLTASIDYVPGQGNDRFTMQSGNFSPNRIVMSAGQSDNAILIAQNGQTKLLLLNNNDGSSRESEFDPDNMHPYTELDITKGTDGKVTAAQMKFDGQSTTADFSAVGQVLGSALGRALAPNNQFVQLAAGTVIGAIGQKLAQAFAASLTTNGATFDLSRTFADFNVSLAGAGASSVASFLVAELGTALHLDGFGGQLFNASAGGFTGSVASQVATKMAQGASFDAAIGTINFADAAASAAYGVSALFGSFLAHEFVPAQTHEGAVGGQLLGAIGSAAGISAALSGALGTVLGFIVPGLGSLIGTILGTLIGDAFGNVPHPAAVDLLDQHGYLYGATHYQVSASDGGDYSTPDQMVVPALAIINAYLGAVKGAALDHSKQVTLGYQANPVFYIDGVPGHPAIGEYLYPNAAVQAAALDVLQNTEVIGGDLLMKRAHQNSSSNHSPAPAPVDSNSNGDPGPTGSAVVVSAAEQLAVMSGDLGVAQD
ncbi:phage tail family protein, partial [Bradyrhizobium sp.]